MIIAFDYSMSSPAMCITSTGEWTDSKIWFLTDKKKYNDVFLNGKIIGTQHFDWTTPEQRFDNISSHFINIASKEAANADTYLEGYAMGAKGQIFQIGECAGLLKHKLWERDHKITLIAPTVIKRFATGSGSADKIKMAEAFKNQTKVDLAPIFGRPGTSPSSDIIDSFFLARYSFTIKDA